MRNLIRKGVFFNLHNISGFLISGGGLMNTSLSRVLDCRKAAWISTDTCLNLELATTAMRSLNDSLDTVGLSDYSLRVSWKLRVRSVAFVFFFWPSCFSLEVITHLEPMVSWPLSLTSSKMS